MLFPRTTRDLPIRNLIEYDPPSTYRRNGVINALVLFSTLIPISL